MKNTLHQIIWGKDKRFNGLIALGIVTLIVLGCNCNKLNELAQNSSNTSTNPSNTFSPPNNTATAPKKDTTYTKADASKKEIPSDAEMQEIAKATLLDFNDALQSEDFTNFHGKISNLWRKQTTPDKLKQTFQSFIDGQANMSSISSMDATFTSPPKIIRELGMNMLEAKGEYPTYPIKTTFELKYAAEGKDWKLTSIRVFTAIKK